MRSSRRTRTTARSSSTSAWRLRGTYGRWCPRAQHRESRPRQRVRGSAAPGGGLLDLVEICRAHVVDVAPEHLMVEIAAEGARMAGFRQNVRPYGVLEMVRTGRVAMLRGTQTTAVHEDEPDDIERF